MANLETALACVIAAQSEFSEPTSLIIDSARLAVLTALVNARIEAKEDG